MVNVDMDFYKEVGQNIFFLRKKKGMTREQFSEALDISPKYLYEIEKGKKRFSAELLVKVAEISSISCDYVVYMGSSSNTQNHQDRIC